MSTSLRNVVQRRNHKERGQLASREKLGLLEKKKDYLQRAKDYHGKQKRLKALREKALFRNPDEFYYKMINTQTKVRNTKKKPKRECTDRGYCIISMGCISRNVTKNCLPRWSSC
jgi:U3 small nucleolar RNA-associated protein 11